MPTTYGFDQDSNVTEAAKNYNVQSESQLSKSAISRLRQQPQQTLPSFTDSQSVLDMIAIDSTTLSPKNTFLDQPP